MCTEGLDELEGGSFDELQFLSVSYPSEPWYLAVLLVLYLLIHNERARGIWVQDVLVDALFTLLVIVGKLLLDELLLFSYQMLFETVPREAGHRIGREA